VGVLSGQSALVSGGGRGIGKAIALAFAAEGATVAVAARTRPELDEVAAACGPRAIALTLDVSDPAACQSSVARCESEWGKLDVLVNNAGIASSHKFTDLDAETWERTLAVNLSGPFHLTQAALPGMLERGSGSVIAIASILSKVGRPYTAAYAAAKHGLLGMMRACASEYSRRGVTFNCVCPGFVDTPMTEQTIANIMAKTGRSREDATSPLFTPQGRLVQPDEVAAVCVLLASPAGRGITGQAINVDGGDIQS
jgi:NAD(P)-dependent dehydrogenase (short-subunit alcohol dehydrogenase family)